MVLKKEYILDLSKVFISSETITVVQTFNPNTQLSIPVSYLKSKDCRNVYVIPTSLGKSIKKKLKYQENILEKNEEMDLHLNATPWRLIFKVVCTYNPNDRLYKVNYSPTAYNHNTPTVVLLHKTEGNHFLILSVHDLDNFFV